MGVLHDASLTGCVRKISLALQAGEKVDTEDEFSGKTALMWAGIAGHAAAIRMLLEAGAAVDVADSNGCTALMLASTGIGAMMDAATSSFGPAVTHASEHASEGAVRALLEAGAGVELVDNRGMSALAFATQMGRAGVAQLLEARAAVVRAGREGIHPSVRANTKAPIGDAAAQGAAARDRGTASFKRGDYKAAAEVLQTRLSTSPPVLWWSRLRYYGWHPLRYCGDSPLKRSGATTRRLRVYCKHATITRISHACLLTLECFTNP